MAGTRGLPTWVAYSRHMVILPPISTASKTFRGYRIPRPAVPLEGETPPGLICWGTVGDLPSPEQLPSVGFTVVHNEEWKEWGRKTEDVRIENPDDPSQYIIDRRPTEISFDKTTLPSQAGNNTSAAEPPGLPDLPPESDSFIQYSDGRRTKVKIHYSWIKPGN
jgi:hypothetical protein